MRVCFRAFALITSISLIGGCGQSDPAYVPPPLPPAAPSATVIVVQNVHPSADRPGLIVGDWSADLTGRPKGGAVQLGLLRHEGDKAASHSNWHGDNAIDGLPAESVSGPAHFELSRAAGGLQFDGISDGKTAHGVVRFAPDAVYSSEIKRMYGKVSPDRLYELDVVGYDIAYGEALYDAGYRLSLDEALALFQANVSSDYAIELRKAGYEFSFGDIIHLRHSGIASGFAKEIREGGWQLSAEDLILLNHSGVATDFAIATREAGAAATVSDVVYLQHSGVPADYVRQLAAAGYKFAAPDVVKLNHGAISADYAAAFKKAGYTLSADELLRLYHGGVDSDFAAALIAPGHQNLAVDDIVYLHQHGLDAEMVRKIRR